MPLNLKKTIKSLFVISNILIIIPYLLICLVPFLPADKYWIIASLGLFFPVLFFLIIWFFIIFLIVRSRWYILSLAALLLSLQQIATAFAFRRQDSFNINKPVGTLRVISWNVGGWDERNKELKKGMTYRQNMMDLIKSKDADILCLQEFMESSDPRYYDKNIPLLQKMGFTYHYFIPSLKWAGNDQGVIILSKYPFTDTMAISYGENTKGEHLAYADIKADDKTIRVMTTHLQSVELDADDYALRYPKEVIYKLKTGYGHRTSQAQMIKQYINKSPYPVIFCGDIIDIPNSYTYFTIRGKLQDAFLQKGSGFGQTLRILSPTLRIDYILTDKKFKVEQFDRIKVPYSEHYPLVSDFTLK